MKPVELHQYWIFEADANTDILEYKSDNWSAV